MQRFATGLTLFAAVCLTSVPTVAQEQPAQEQPAPEEPARDGPVLDFDDDVLDELEEEPTPDAPAAATAGGTTLGGYGQFNLTALQVGPDARYDVTATVRRLVLFVSHAFGDDFRMTAELEWEHAIACSSCQGSVEIEQAYVDWDLVDDRLTLRAGLVLVPMGIVNLWHEPPVFFGVERPRVDQVIIPTTWRELGVGVVGSLGELWRYQLYVTTPLDPEGFAPGGLAGARTIGSLAPTRSAAVTGRLEVEPFLGVVFGLAAYASDVGNNAEFFGATGNRRDLTLPIVGYAVDARFERWGVEARAVWSQFFLPESGAMMSSFRRDGSPWFPNAEATGPVPTRIDGGYLEAAYDLFHTLDAEHQLFPFVRLETYDTQAGVPDGFEANPRLDVDELTAGLSYLPIPQVVFKADLQLRDRRLGLDEHQLNAGFGFMF